MSADNCWRLYIGYVSFGMGVGLIEPKATFLGIVFAGLLLGVGSMLIAIAHTKGNEDD